MRLNIGCVPACRYLHCSLSGPLEMKTRRLQEAIGLLAAGRTNYLARNREASASGLPPGCVAAAR